MSESQKKTLLVLFLIYLGLGLVNFIFFPSANLEGVGLRWTYTFGDTPSFWNTINPMTLIMSGLIILLLIVFAAGVKFELIPNKKQSIVEALLEYFWELVEDAVPNQRYRKAIFAISTTLFLFILVANLLSGFPGINVAPTEEGIKFGILTDTWYTPTSDLNTNGTFAVMVLVISHIFAIKAKGIGSWIKMFFEPTPLLFPLNLIGEIAKPVSHSLRLFGNIFGGGILVLIISYMIKYFVLPVFLWGFFGIFVGFIQAFVFSLLAIAYMGSLLEE
ncbi:ATP synthase F0F1 subunit A [Marinitoga sp. 1135]|uniref:ATP synthase subunit a n=1 Tax=Marinitoga piezophila (strain DSM 14283 / JCM 11233 / KA3) TaxID=443254 RepID=H2J4N7_MARPK|nr:MULTISPECIES: F0F1 ATP synthase subunit A [Marinitoga]AEX85979.1 F0F1-type ATP synthase, alpha subunit [Marinitoga piezophila KA3]APT76402.1 ATP synthase F0F1 subunit A [Marinitoga sp. 1137]NUU96173.1 ATP synthase F0F1 subunit A [Marinitoga sp. 1135]NUU98081.1 ATP synthase F0F1 subunit A [Marinitoga sp. 1138]